MKDIFSSLLDREKKKKGDSGIDKVVTLDQVKENQMVESYLTTADRHLSSGSSNWIDSQV